MKRILLTGGSGFIGRNIRESFLAEKYEIVSPSHKEVNWADSEAMDAWFSTRSFDAVIHAAVKPGHRNAPDHEHLLYTNTRMFFNLVCHADCCGRILNIGSGAIYGMRHYEPAMKEDFFGWDVWAAQWRERTVIGSSGFTRLTSGRTFAPLKRCCM